DGGSNPPGSKGLTLYANAVRQFKIEEDSMIWPFKGKMEGKDVNDVPGDYIEWAAKASKNPTTKAQAVKVLAYREGSQGPATTSNVRSGPKTSGVSTRAKALELAIMMDNKNPWPYIKATLDYIQTGQLPNLASMLGDESPEQEKKPKTEPFKGFELSSDDEIPF
ncbi:hypothetical protein LCGC14_3029300, partial [marine sediment metagenome]